MSKENSRTISVAEAGSLLGISRGLSYTEARKGSLAGVEVLRIGRRMVLSREKFEAMLGGHPG